MMKSTTTLIKRISVMGSSLTLRGACCLVNGDLIEGLVEDRLVVIRVEHVDGQRLVSLEAIKGHILCATRQHVLVLQNMSQGGSDDEGQ